jgi:uncharacterized membrane protein YbhN (UPF0104 family)
MDRVTRWALRVATLAAVAAGLYFAGRGVSTAQLIHVLRSTRVAELAAWAVLLMAIGFALRAGRFRAVLGETSVSFPGVVASVLLSQAANNVLPLRAGELVKTRDFAAAGHPLGRVVAAQGAEKLVEVTSLVLLCAPALAASFGYRRPAILLVVLLAGGVPPLVWIARRYRMPATRIGGAFAWSLGADAVEIALVALTLRSLGLASGLGASLVVLGAVNLAIALPSAPGHAGALEAGAALGLMAIGVARESALAFALLYRVVQWVPITLGGAAVWAWRAIGRRRFSVVRPPAPPGSPRPRSGPSSWR